MTRRRVEPSITTANSVSEDPISDILQREMAVYSFKVHIILLIAEMVSSTDIKQYSVKYARVSTMEIGLNANVNTARRPGAQVAKVWGVKSPSLR